MKRHALFVGVDEYADPTIQNLAFPTEDATELASAFAARRCATSRWSRCRMIEFGYMLALSPLITGGEK